MHAETSIWLYIAVMAGVTYAIRLLPLLILRREIRNVWFRSFLHYVPYATLTAMTVPAALMGDLHFLSGLLGLATAGLLSYLGRNLLLSAAAASLAVWLAESLF